jgi:hypothetical protein
MTEKETIFLKLRQDHDIQRELLDHLLKTSGDSEDRKVLFEQLKKELSIHAKYEERHFYKSLIDFDLTQDKARHSVAEHKDIDDLIEDLEDKDMSSSGWLVKAKELEHKVTHHLDEEEQEVFQLAGKVLSESQKISLAKDYEKDMDQDEELILVRPY